jgi:malate dehydrogenase (oxaloacetate-decarboxylating)
VDKGDIYKSSLELHKRHQGKLEVNSSVPITNRDELSLAYTPGVAAVSRAIAEDKELARELTIKGRTIAVVSDGSAVLGLGNIGPEAALPVMEGKAALFKEFGGVDAFPIVLSTQDVDEIVETVERIAPGFGGINLEDISAPRCFEVERRLKESLGIPVFHDDQHGTAVVVLAGLINALKLRESPKEGVRVVLNGAGAAGISISKMLLEYGFKDLVVCDSKGAIYLGREDLDGEKEKLAKLSNLEKKKGNLSDVLRGADVFIGVSKAGLLSKEMVESMNARPIIFAMANPDPEIEPNEAHDAGAFVVATGRSDFPNQVNNVLVFPGIFRGALDNRVRDITNEMLVRAAENLASCVKDLSVDKILPPVFDRAVVKEVAKAIKSS